LFPLALPGTGELTQTPRAYRISFGGSPRRPRHRAFYTKAIEWKKRPSTRRVWALAQLHPPNPPPRPASGSHRLPNTLGQVGEQYGPLIAPFARARCPFSPLLRPYFPGGAARGSHSTGQFSCFGPRSCFIAFVLDKSDGVWPLNRAVGRAYIRKTVPT
jgi:hypothetical protein